MKAKTYETPAAFKRALEDRLKAGSKTGVDFARRRQLLALEAHAEKVRAAFTREAIRDFYDLDRLLDAGADLSSPGRSTAATW